MFLSSPVYHALDLPVEMRDVVGQRGMSGSWSLQTLYCVSRRGRQSVYGALSSTHGNFCRGVTVQKHRFVSMCLVVPIAPLYANKTIQTRKPNTRALVKAEKTAQGVPGQLRSNVLEIHSAHMKSKAGKETKAPSNASIQISQKKLKPSPSRADATAPGPVINARLMSCLPYSSSPRPSLPFPPGMSPLP